MRALVMLLLASPLTAQPIDLRGEWQVNLTDSPRWASPETDSSDWAVVHLPQRAPRTERIYWLRRTVATPAQSEAVVVTIGLVSESYELYWNGVKVGDTGDFGQPEVHHPQPRSFRIPPGLVPAQGTVVIALHIWNTGVVWGAFASGVPDEGPYWITQPEHVHAEVESARRGMWIAIIPTPVVLTAQLGIALFLLVLWFSERERREHLYFCAYLLVNSTVIYAGVWVLVVGASSNWQHYFYRPFGTLVFLFLSLFAASLFRMARPSPFLMAGVMLVSLYLAIAPVRAIHYLQPWLALITGQCIYAMWLSPRTNTLFAVPILIYVAALFNNSMPAAMKLFSSTIFLGAMTLAVTNLIQILFSGAMMILLLLRLAADRREKQRLAGEIEAARLVQHLLLGSNTEPSHGFTVEVEYHPAQEVGGDFYQVLPLEDGLLVVVGDVSGKGLKAAMVVAMVTGVVRSHRKLPPAELLGEINRAIAGSSDGGFVSCVAARCTASGVVTIASAGHLAPYLEGAELSLDNGLPLGIDFEAAYTETDLPLPAGGQMTFLTDGVVEAASTTDELFGFDRTREISEQSAAAIADAAKAWGQNDDITVVTVRRQA